MPRLSLATVAIGVLLSGCSLFPEARWKVDVINGDKPLLISITTDSAAWAWYVPANARIVILDEQLAPVEGVIELIDPQQDCLVYDRAEVPREPFTIRPVQVQDTPQDFALGLAAGAPLVGPVNTDYFGGCSG